MKISQTVIQQAKDGDQTAQELIVAANIATIHRLATEYAGIGIEAEDLRQEGLIGLFAAVTGYRAECKTQFTTFAYRCIVNSMLTAVKKAQRKKHEPLNRAKPLSENEQTISTEQLALYNEQFRLLNGRINTELTVLERKVLFAYIDGVDYTTIALKCNISTKSVDNALYRVRKKLKARNKT